MRAISLHQPWATLIALGIKQTETRHWSTPFRGQTAIHAALVWGPTQRAAAACFAEEHPGHAELLRNPPRGGIVAVTDLVDCYKFFMELPLYVTGADYNAGNMSPGRFGWRLEGTVAIDFVPEKGRQRFWTLRGKVLASVLAQINPTNPDLESQA